MNKKPFKSKNYQSERIPLGVENKKPTLKSRFFYYSLSLATIFLIYINVVSPEFIWPKIIFFFIIFCFFFSTLCIFSQKYILNLIKAFYPILLILLLFFNQLNLLNFIIITFLLITVLFFISNKITKT